MRNGILVSILLIGCVRADDGCPPVRFTSVRSATLTPFPGTHRILLRQGSTYTAYEAANAPPYSVIRTIPHFEKQLSACLPAISGLDFFGALAMGQGASGGYVIATMGLNLEPQVNVFDAGLNLIAEAPLNGVSPLAFADLNGDGKPDIIGTTSPIHGDRMLAIALGSGGASFEPPTLYRFSAGYAIVAVAVADVNGDKKPDLVVLSAGLLSSYGVVSVFLGNGDGTFQAEKIVTAVSEPLALAVADLNGDGRPDLVFTATDVSSSSQAVEVALGVGDGTFGTPVLYPVANNRSVAIGDLNGDDIPDIVTLGVTILFGDGKGGFPSRRDTLVETQGNLIVTDFDGDGIADIVVAAGNAAIMGGDAVSVLSGLGKGAFAGPPVIPHSSLVLASADVNGDGTPDLVSADLLGNVAVLKGSGDGSFQSTFQFTFMTGLVSDFAFADFDHDGHLDLAVVGSTASTGSVDIVLGNGDGTFLSPTHIPAPLGAFSLIARDFNGDGKVDLAVLISQEASAVSDSVQILLGNGDGTFNAGATYPVGPWAHSFAAGDFNGDGKLDLIVADAGTYANQNQDGNITLLSGKGDGTFAAPVVTPLTGGFVRGPYSVVAADFNGDGKLDLALTLSDQSHYLGGLVTMLGRGDGTFQPPVIYAADAVEVQAGDLNEDGILDLIISAHALQNLEYLIGDRDGSFHPPVRFNMDGTLNLVLADFNRDGKLDVAANNGAGIAIFSNEGRAAPLVTVVSAASLTPGPVAPDSIATAFGTKLAPSTVSISIEDSTGTIFPASVSYSSQSQINFAIPAGIEAGPATVTIASASGGSTPQSGAVVIAPVAPSLFTVNEQGLAAGYVTRVPSTGPSTNEPIVSFQNGIYVPIPIDVTAGSTYLILFGTGLRNAIGFRAFMNGPISLETSYIGPQPTAPGLDQVNLLLPPSLAGSGCSNLTLTYESASPISNTVYVCIR